ncbi:glycine cleavage system aminomethyltransferase T [Sinorhizobium terangae]|nr:glycine cleavage system aminomethyltransferase T [Sinorhizobium terangae]
MFGGALYGCLFRISFSGELAYELAVPAGYGESVAVALMEAGKGHGIMPYGAEALSVLRIEKGHVTHNEINGTVIPADLGFGKMVSATKPNFIGKAMLQREGLAAPDRPQLVGVVPLDPKPSFRSGSHILAKGAAATLENDEGYVTSSAHSIASTITPVPGGVGPMTIAMLMANRVIAAYRASRVKLPEQLSTLISG